MSTARICRCHINRKEAVASGMSFAEADQKYSKPGYHEHRCECLCGCKRDTLGYGYCPTCHFSSECLAKRNEAIGILGIPFQKE